MHYPHSNVYKASDTDITALRGDVLNDQLADGMIENMIGHFELPLGVATNKPALWRWSILIVRPLITRAL
ncbi:MAG: hypothetical protein ACPGSM_20085 [Thiolinea sp.]